MAGGFGFPKYPQKKSPNPKMVGELLARANTPPMPGMPQGPAPTTGIRPSPSGMPLQPVATHSQSPGIGLRK